MSEPEDIDRMVIAVHVEGESKRGPAYLRQLDVIEFALGLVDIIKQVFP